LNLLFILAALQAPRPYDGPLFDAHCHGALPRILGHEEYVALLKKSEIAAAM
jgi:hypothetical protein